MDVVDVTVNIVTYTYRYNCAVTNSHYDVLLGVRLHVSEKTSK